MTYLIKLIISITILSVFPIDNSLLDLLFKIYKSKFNSPDLINNKYLAKYLPKIPNEIIDSMTFNSDINFDNLFENLFEYETDLTKDEKLNKQRFLNYLEYLESSRLKNRFEFSSIIKLAEKYIQEERIKENNESFLDLD